MNSFTTHYFNEDLISEMLVKGKRKSNEREDIMAFNKWIYFLDEDDPQYENIKKEIVKFLDIENKVDPEDMDIYDFKQTVGEYVTDLLMGSIENNELYVDSYGTFKLDPKSSILIKKVVKQLGIENVTYPEDMESTETTVSKWEVKGKIPDIAYHGTSTEYFEDIARLGLRPGSRESNWLSQGIEHPDKVFFTTRIGEAQSHSVMTANKKGGYPMIIEFKIPDKNKMIADYDVEVQTHEPQFYDYHMHDPTEKTLRKKSFSVSKEFGVYGYKGNVMPINIESVYIAFKEPNEVYGMDDYTELDIDEAKRELGLEWEEDEDWEE